MELSPTAQRDTGPTADCVLSAVNHFRKLLQQVVLSDTGVHIIIKVVVSKLIDQLLEVIHGRGGGSGARGGGSPGCCSAEPP